MNRNAAYIRRASWLPRLDIATYTRWHYSRWNWNVIHRRKSICVDPSSMCEALGWCLANEKVFISDRITSCVAILTAFRRYRMCFRYHLLDRHWWTSSFEWRFRKASVWNTVQSDRISRVSWSIGNPCRRMLWPVQLICRLWCWRYKLTFW